MAGKRVARKSVAAQIAGGHGRSEEHTSELQSQSNLVCRLLLEKKKKKARRRNTRLIRRNTVKQMSTEMYKSARALEIHCTFTVTTDSAHMCISIAIHTSTSCG